MRRILFALLLPLIVATLAAGQNLLRNPEFTQTGGDANRLWYYGTDDNGQLIVEINIPWEWEYWWARPYDDNPPPRDPVHPWGRPEFVLRMRYQIEVDVELVAGDRDRCQKSFTAWRPKHDKFFQTVTLDSGRYRFTWTVTQHQRASVNPSVPATDPITGQMRLYAEGDGWESGNPLLDYSGYPNMTASPMVLDFDVPDRQQVRVGLEMLGVYPVTDNAWWIRNDPRLVRIGDAAPTPTPTATITPTPTIPDLDGDRVLDGVEGWPPLPGQSHRLLADSDGDGLADNEEDTNANGARDPGETSTRLRDSDGDMAEDGIERLVLDSDPLDPADPTAFVDADGDGLPAGPDLFDSLPDSDSDRFLDGFERVVLGIDAPYQAGLVPLLGDTNGDGFVTNVDALLVHALFLRLSSPGAPAFGGDGFTQADPNRDGTVSNVDALALQAFFLRLVQMLPIQ